jgi:CYTH domain-containing protein
MAREIERKFLVRDRRFEAGADATRYRQGYLSTEPERNVRVRTKGERAYLTVKGKADDGPAGLVRLEYEYEVPPADADEILDRLCHKPLIEKDRYRVEHGGLTWEVDVFHGDNEGLVVAEVELDDPDQPFEKPPWVGEEVTGDPRYLNANLVRKPYREWGD